LDSRFIGGKLGRVVLTITKVVNKRVKISMSFLLNACGAERRAFGKLPYFVFNHSSERKRKTGMPDSKGAGEDAAGEEGNGWNSVPHQPLDIFPSAFLQ
jgi:hypothetical protein